MTPFDRLRELIRRKSSFFRAVFNPETVAGRAVLADLAEFCRAHDTTFHPDPRTHALLEGRREVWLRIQTYSRLTDDEIITLRAEALAAKKTPAG